MKFGAFVRSLFGSVMSTRINVRILMNVPMKLLLPSLLSFVLISSHGQIKCYTKDFKTTELGVWSTDNINVASPVWNSTNGGLANVRTDMLRIRKGDNTIMAATHGRGVFTALIPSELDQTVSFKTFASKTFGDPSFKIWAQSTSGLPITFTSTNTSVATVVDSTVTIVGGGTTTLVASQSGKATYKPAISVDKVLTVNKDYTWWRQNIVCERGERVQFCEVELSAK